MEKQILQETENIVDSDKFPFNYFLNSLKAINLINNKLEGENSHIINFIRKYETMEKYILSEYKTIIEEDQSKLNHNIKNIINYNETIEQDIEIKNYHNIAIIYHFPCFDGCFSAVNAHLYYNFFSEKKRTLNFFPMNNIDRLCDIFDIKTFENYSKIFIFDKGLSKKDFEYLLNIENKINPNQRIFLFDHHISSINIFIEEFLHKFLSLKNFLFIFEKDENKSACGITYEFFHNKTILKIKKIMKRFQLKDINNKNEINKYPLLKEKYDFYLEYFNQNYKNIIDYVEDSDIGKCSLLYNHEFRSGLSNYIFPLKSKCDFSNKKIYNIKPFLDVNFDFCIKSGFKSYNQYKQKAINEISGNNVFLVCIKYINDKENSDREKNKWTFLACYSQTQYLRNYGAIVLSEISEMKGYDPIGSFIYHKEKDIYKISMRSHSENINLGFICEKFGGGGHKKSASFTERNEYIHGIKIKKLQISNDIKILNQSKNG